MRVGFVGGISWVNAGEDGEDRDDGNDVQWAKDLRRASIGGVAAAVTFVGGGDRKDMFSSGWRVQICEGEASDSASNL